MNTAVHFSSKTDMWETPQGLFDRLDCEFRFDRDVCATQENTKKVKYFSPEDDGLSQRWTGICWMNPPYGNPQKPCKPDCKKKTCAKRGYHITEHIPGIIDWMRKAYESSFNGATVVCLVPCRTDTEWWHKYVMQADEVRIIKGRLKFGGHKNSAPFPSAVVVFKPYPKPERKDITFKVLRGIVKVTRGASK